MFNVGTRIINKDEQNRRAISGPFQGLRHRGERIFANGFALCWTEFALSEPDGKGGAVALVKFKKSTGACIAAGAKRAAIAPAANRVIGELTWIFPETPNGKGEEKTGSGTNQNERGDRSPLWNRYLVDEDGNSPWPWITDPSPRPSQKEKGARIR